MFSIFVSLNLGVGRIRKRKQRRFPTNGLVVQGHTSGGLTEVTRGESGNLEDLEDILIHHHYKKILNHHQHHDHHNHLKSIYIHPQTGTFADPETHPLRAFVPFLPRAVLALGPLFLAFLNASLASVHTWNGNMLIPVFKVLRNGLLRYILYTCPNM